MDDQNRVHDESIDPGELVYDSNGGVLGRITGFTDEGFEVETTDLDESDGKEVPGKEFGEGYLMWRCTECGEMGELEDGMPESCPVCGAPQEALSGERED